MDIVSDKADLLALAQDLVANHHDRLAPDFFDATGNPHNHIMTKMLDIAHTVYKQNLSFFPTAEIKDILFAGSMCGYCYNKDSDIDLFIIVENIFPQDPDIIAPLLKKIDALLATIYWKPTLFGHPVDFGFLLPTDIRTRCRNHYSLLNRKWNVAPIKQNFLFSAETLLEEYLHTVKRFEDYEKQLTFINHQAQQYLDLASAAKAGKYMQYIASSAYMAKETLPEYEYSLEYNIFRLMKRSGFYQAKTNFIKLSYNLGAALYEYNR